MIDLKCKACGAFTDFTGILSCPGCQQQALTYPTGDILDALIQLQKVQMELLTNVSLLLTNLSGQIDRIHDELNDLTSEDFEMSCPKERQN